MMPDNAEIVPNYEVARIIWVPAEIILDPEKHRTFVHHYDSRSAEMKCIDYEGSRIWGMTYRMLEHFSEAVRGG